ncbi:MAG: peptidylprolyl isomerase [Bacilli bacterium]|nr:peptidylprolyl isomerase [Bacilli bacterium]
MNNKKILIIVLAIIALLGCFIAIRVITKKGEKNMGKVNIEISVKNYGIIELELDGDVAPITVENFVNLVNDGFYNGLTFHRIISGFMIQGGDPNGNGTGGSNKKIKGEFSKNGVENNISHVRGTISMARSGGNPDTEYTMNSASSQFFIVHEDSTYLDGNYAAFGHVTSGMEVVDKIANDAQPIDRNGTISRDKQPVIEYIKVK